MLGRYPLTHEQHRTIGAYVEQARTLEAIQQMLLPLSLHPAQHRGNPCASALCAVNEMKLDFSAFREMVLQAQT